MIKKMMLKDFQVRRAQPLGVKFTKNPMKNKEKKKKLRRLKIRKRLTKKVEINNMIQKRAKASIFKRKKG